MLLPPLWGSREMTAGSELLAALQAPGLLRVAGAYDALSARLVDRHGFGGIWAGGLSIGAALGLPDAGILTLSELLSALNVMSRNTRLPIIADCDNGFGDINVLMRVVSESLRAGAAAICIEDKEMPKRNSFRSGNHLTPTPEFSAKVSAASAVSRMQGALLIARLESFIVGEHLDRALVRAHSYCDAGADALIVHSSQAHADEVLAFARRWKMTKRTEPLLVIPTTYFRTELTELEAARVGGVIFANQSIRASLRAIDVTLSRLAVARSGAAVEDSIATLEELFDLVDMASVEFRCEQFQRDVVAYSTNEGQHDN